MMIRRSSSLARCRLPLQPAAHPRPALPCSLLPSTLHHSRSLHLLTAPKRRLSSSIRSSTSSSSCRCISCTSLSLPFSSPSCAVSSVHRPSLLRSPVRCFSSDDHDSHAMTSDFLPRDDVERRVLAVLKGIEKLSSATISSTSSFHDLGLDSLDQVEVVMQLEEEFCVDLFDPDAAKITSVKEAIDVFSTFPFAQ